MSTIVVVKKNNEIAIGADTLTKFGETKQYQKYLKSDFNKIIEIGKDNYMALVGNASINTIIYRFIKNNNYQFSSKENIFEFAIDLHNELKDKYFFNPIFDEDDEFECSRFECLIANPHGIFGIDAYRYVEEYTQFFSYGSGYKYSLGAMQATYDIADLSAKDIALKGLNAGVEFDPNSGNPLELHSFSIK